MCLDKCSLPKRLGVGVGIRPAKGLRSSRPGLDELFANPLVTQLFSPDSDDVTAGGAELMASSLRHLVLDGTPT